MNGYYDNAQKYHDRGIDYDLATCLYYNPQEGFDVDDVKSVLAVWEGQNDEDDWRWVFELSSGQIIFLQGGCCYTGWDCLSWAIHMKADTSEEAAEYALGNFELKDVHPANAGLGHAIAILAGTYMNNAEEVRDSLLSQLAEGKNKTWTESKNEEFDLVIPPDSEE